MLDKDIRNALDREYAEALRAVSEAQAGDDEARWQLQKLEELHKQRMNEEQAERENRDSKASLVAKVALDSAAIVVPCAVSSYWMSKGLEFETTGCFTSKVGAWVSGIFRVFRK